MCINVNLTINAIFSLYTYAYIKYIYDKYYK